MLRCGLVALVVFVGLAWSDVARADAGLLPNVHLLEAFERVTGAGALVPQLASATDAESGGLLPCTLSCLVPGLGQLFNGQVVKGLLLAGAWVLTVGLTAAMGITLPGLLALALTIAVYVVATIDAYNGGTLLPDWGGAGPKKQVIREEEVAPPLHAAADRRP